MHANWYRLNHSLDFTQISSVLTINVTRHLSLAPHLSLSFVCSCFGHLFVMLYFSVPSVQTHTQKDFGSKSCLVWCAFAILFIIVMCHFDIQVKTNKYRGQHKFVSIRYSSDVNSLIWEKWQLNRSFAFAFAFAFRTQAQSSFICKLYINFGAFTAFVCACLFMWVSMPIQLNIWLCTSHTLHVTQFLPNIS